MNGDGNACTVHFDGVTWKGTDLYVVFKDQCNTTALRITGLLYYYPTSIMNNI